MTKWISFIHEEQETRYKDYKVFFPSHTRTATICCLALAYTNSHFYINFYRPPLHLTKTRSPFSDSLFHTHFYELRLSFRLLCPNFLLQQWAKTQSLMKKVSPRRPKFTLSLSLSLFILILDKFKPQIFLGFSHWSLLDLKNR